MSLSIYGELSKIDISKCVNEVVDAILPRGTKNKVLVVSIRMEAENYKTHHCVGKIFNIIFYRPSNYTFVGVRIPSDDKDDKNIFFPDRIESDLKRYCYHDSCWRYDGTEDIIKENVNDILSKLKNEGKGYSVHTSFGLTPFKLIDGYVDIQDYNTDKLSRFIPTSIK